ncbi:hypothetical protein Rhopal_007184-T1 [Rhodotorula paludigena]|uniref:Uncharacterized protein n=1 Tax=Rhodotorula paludigena TaxID=86838 RepID=A0AAV5GXB0_9BASI|nr:hypothetical protein Rhopal_007184-T1 [Rhodotorula paludigena]
MGKTETSPTPIVDTPSGPKRLYTVQAVRDEYAKPGPDPRLPCECGNGTVTARLAFCYSPQNVGEVIIQCHKRVQAVARAHAKGEKVDYKNLNAGCDLVLMFRDLGPVHREVVSRAMNSGQLTATLPSPITRIILDEVLDENNLRARLALPTFTHDKTALLDLYALLAGNPYASRHQDMARLHQMYDVMYPALLMIQNKIVTHKNEVHANSKSAPIDAHAELDRMFQAPVIPRDAIRKFANQLDSAKYRKTALHAPMRTYPPDTPFLSPAFPGAGQLLSGGPSTDGEIDRTPVQLSPIVSSPQTPIKHSRHGHAQNIKHISNRVNPYPSRKPKNKAPSQPSVDLGLDFDLDNFDEVIEAQRKALERYKPKSRRAPRVDRQPAGMEIDFDPVSDDDSASKAVELERRRERRKMLQATDSMKRTADRNSKLNRL